MPFGTGAAGYNFIVQVPQSILLEGVNTLKFEAIHDTNISALWRRIIISIGSRFPTGVVSG
jgi:hypothetical protein